MTETCPTCKGTGRAWGLVCHVCDGGGNVPHVPQPEPPKPKPKPKG